MRDQVSKDWQTAYLEIRRNGSIRITTETKKTLGSCLVIYPLNYRNLLLAGVPKKHLAQLQRVMNCAACLVCRALFWLTCTGFLCLTEINTGLLLSATMLYPVLHLCILQIFSCTLPPSLSTLLLIPIYFAFQSEARNSRGSTLFLKLALSSGIVSHIHLLPAMLRLCEISNQN